MRVPVCPVTPASRPGKQLWNPSPADTGPRRRAQELDLQTLSKLLCAYATLGVMPERLAAAGAAEVKRRLPGESVPGEALVGLLWSLCLFQVCWLFRVRD